MKKALIPLLMLLPLAAFASPDAPPPPGPGGGDHGPRMDMMMRQLDLTDAQREQMNKIFEDHRDKMQALREDTEKQINAILTPEQKAKMDEMRAKRKKMWEKRKEKWEKQHGDKMGGRRDDD